ncbi:MAG: YaaA family protein [Arcobacter sp.]|uniref:YaaA family protein n=1 Tax=Arcobacter sp. TaxID=1872629 RepID=UPI003CFC2C94
MKILFSPSETKNSGGITTKFDNNSFIFPELFEKRMQIVNAYNSFIKKATKDELIKLFGTKKDDVLEQYKKDIFETPTMKVIERYEGVAFDYLEYGKLNKEEKSYIDENVIIFSNLFGPLSAGNSGLPDYKLKQGKTFDSLKIEKFYMDNFSKVLDEYLENEDIIDLRAGFYEKFYKIDKPYTTMKFIKDGKVVSHWAKAYRGIILKLLAKNQIKTIDELMNMQIENLKIQEIKKQKLKTEIVYSII